MTNNEKTPPTLRVFKIKLPMRVKTSSKKKQALNLNVYRNLHHRSLHAQKKKFEEIAKKLLRGIPPLGVITLHYEVWVETKRRLDVMNVGSIVDKYFSDTLTEVGIIEDDDYKHIPRVDFTFGGITKPEHILVTITEIEPRKETKPMRVLLDDADILKALTAYVETLNIPNASGVELTAVDGKFTAEVMFLPIAELPSTDPLMVPEDIPEAPEGEITEEVKPKRRKRRTKAEMEADKAREANADVDETAATSPDSGDGGDTPEPEAVASAVVPTETSTDAKPETTKKGNLFGDKDDPSSESDGQTEVALDTAPVPVAEPPVKKGSIFDA